MWFGQDVIRSICSTFLKLQSRSLLVNYSPKHGIYWVPKTNFLLPFSVIVLEKSNQIKIISLQSVNVENSLPTLVTSYLIGLKAMLILMSSVLT